MIIPSYTSSRNTSISARVLYPKNLSCPTPDWWAPLERLTLFVSDIHHPSNGDGCLGYAVHSIFSSSNSRPQDIWGPFDECSLSMLESKPVGSLGVIHDVALRNLIPFFQRPCYWWPLSFFPKTAVYAVESWRGARIDRPARWYKSKICSISLKRYGQAIVVGLEPIRSGCGRERNSKVSTDKTLMFSRSVTGSSIEKAQRKVET